MTKKDYELIAKCLEPVGKLYNFVDSGSLGGSRDELAVLVAQRLLETLSSFQYELHNDNDRFDAGRFTEAVLNPKA